MLVVIVTRAILAVLVHLVSSANGVVSTLLRLVVSLCHVLNLTDGDHLHRLHHLQRGLVHIEIVLSCHTWLVLCDSWGFILATTNSLTWAMSLIRLVTLLARGHVPLVVEKDGRLSWVVVLVDDLLELLDLRLESQVGPLQVLDVLVLCLHSHDLDVEILGSRNFRVVVASAVVHHSMVLTGVKT